MAHKVSNITNAANKYDLLSQTPKNYSVDNYFLKELQEKVNAEWNCRPNRVDVEYETDWGEGVYTPLEVVMQSVKSDKGEDISNDCRRIVFHDIRESRFKIGQHFCFNPTYDISLASDAKDVWLATNTDMASMTSSMIVERCNGTIGSTYQDSQGVTHYHYEPVIQGRELSYVSLHYSETIVSPQSQLLIICQHNDYTKHYFINERFVIGYDKIYRIKAINKFYADSTFKPENVGLMRIYLELTEASAYDNWETHIAYQMQPTVYLDQSGDTGSYQIAFSTPSVIPSELTDTTLTFTPVVKNSSGTEVSASVSTTWSLTNWPSSVSETKWTDYVEGPSQGQTGSFSLKRLKLYTMGDLSVTCSATIDGNAVSASFTLVMRNPA